MAAAPIDPKVTADLREAWLTTALIREHQDGIDVAAERRIAAVERLREAGVTYRHIAQVMGVTEQSVFKIIVKSPNYTKAKKGTTT